MVIRKPDVVKSAESASETVYLAGHMTGKSKLYRDTVVTTFPDYEPQHIVRDLGVILDEDLLNDCRPGLLCKVCFSKIRQSRDIQQNLLHDSFIIAFLVFCNTVLT